jgi:transposase
LYNKATYKTVKNYEVETMGDWLIMSKKERQRKVLLEGVKSGHLTLLEASKRMKLSYRQSKRIWKRYREKEDAGLVHRSRGRKSSHAYPEDFKKQILALYQERYSGFGCCFTAEKLEEHEKIKIHPETLRLWLKGAGLWKGKWKQNPHRQRRPRRERFGEMLQIDGSDHQWFGDDKRSCLLNMVDDATGITLAKMDGGETTQVLLETLKIWVERYGVPKSVYVDLKNVYLSPKGRKWSEDNIEVRSHFSVFERVCERLNIEIIEAYSPQAKGRVERKHQVFQDRFLKELKLHSIKSLEEANQFLSERFLKEINDKFAVSAVSEENAHRDVKAYGDLDQIFCWEHERYVKNDWTFQFKKQHYQIERGQGVRNRQKVLVRQHLDGTVSVWHQEKRLKAERLESRPERTTLMEPENRKADTQPCSVQPEQAKRKSSWHQYNPNWLKPRHRRATPALAGNAA